MLWEGTCPRLGVGWAGGLWAAVVTVRRVSGAGRASTTAHRVKAPRNPPHRGQSSDRVMEGYAAPGVAGSHRVFATRLTRPTDCGAFVGGDLSAIGYWLGWAGLADREQLLQGGGDRRVSGAGRSHYRAQGQSAA